MTEITNIDIQIHQQLILMEIWDLTIIPEPKMWQDHLFII